MMSTVFSRIGLEPVIFRPSLEQTIGLETIKDARGDINEIRMILKGNVETCHRLFKEAVEAGDAVFQIQLAYAYFGMKWGEDEKKDFSSLVASDLEMFFYYPREFILLIGVYEEVMGEQPKKKYSEIYRQAANYGYLPALLEITDKEWKWNTDSYGFAVQLRPYLGQGDKRLDYYFGKALKEGCVFNSKLYHEGLHWMNQSDSSKSSSKDQANVKEIEIAPLDSYLFTYDLEQIKFLLDEYKIGGISTSSFVEFLIEGNPNGDAGYHTYSFTVYQNDEKIGTISVRGDTFEIYETFENEKIKPIIEFIENVMKRSGTSGSAKDWLKQMGGSYI